MPTNKRITDLTNYASVLPYDSGLFGVYQPLIGWKSIRMEERFRKGFNLDKRALLERITNSFAPLVDISYKENNEIAIQLKPGVLETAKLKIFDSEVLRELSSKLPANGKNVEPGVWKEVITPEKLNVILKKNLTKEYMDVYKDMYTTSGVPARSKSSAAHFNQNDLRTKVVAFENQLQYESSMAGAVLFLTKEKNYEALTQIFYHSSDDRKKAEKLLQILSARTSADAWLNISNINPRDADHIKSAAISPISVVHLFRQYFFELDSFLGTPVSHVWLSPGSSVELVEIHTRRTVVEKNLETSLDILTKSEITTTTEDEISDAVKENNQQDIKFGASVTASYASIQATSSFDYSNSQQNARETTHRIMRQQTEKLSSEIRKNHKTTFKTTAEFTDVSNIKHIMANTTNELINYELRRKMRQIGVQVQDIGTYLCWQTYVDDPGSDLGLAKLIHIAKPADLDGIPHPESVPVLQPFKEDRKITIPFISVANGADNSGEVYYNGVEANDEEFMGDLEKIKADFPQEFICPKPGHLLSHVEFDPMGKPLQLSRLGTISNTNNKASFTLHLDMADFQGQNSIEANLILHWSPTDEANAIINEENERKLKEFTEREKTEYEKAYVENVKDRVNKSSGITSRNSNDLREEERIVVYRKLIQDMLMDGVPVPDDRTRHVVAELINSIFDVEKMLYFVAPEWWRPRLHRSRQQLQGGLQITTDIEDTVTGVRPDAMSNGIMRRARQVTNQASAGLMASSSVGWGGINDSVRDNYFITEDSEPAKMGSSLGWLLQLDGDNMRNAFLNAPWVKAVIPIRPGKEEAAINWLKGVEGMNGITDDVIYHASNASERDINGNPLEGQKMMDVLLDLAKKIKGKYEDGLKTGRYPKETEISDPALVDDANTVTATPIDRVYEHGFYPLRGSFRANVEGNYEIFDQWIEVLPTDQIVPVPVKYDPITGRQVITTA
ncbi:MAG: peptidoglycan-binding protein [Bacteroidota bacterium]